MKHLCSVLFAAAMALGAAPAVADVLVIQEGDQTITRARADRPVPTRGMSMNSVETEFGSPNSKVPAIGDPPISRWEYDGFTVYFEHDRVLHSVISDK